MNTILSNLMVISFNRTKYATTKLFSLFALLLILGGNGVMGQTNPSAFALSGGSFSFTSQTATSTSYPTNIQGWNNGGTANLATLSTAASTADFALTASASASTSGLGNLGANGFQFLTTSNASFNTVGAICVSLNTTGRSNILVTWTAADQTNASGRQTNLTLQYRVGTSGTFTTVSSSTYTTNTGGTAGTQAAQTFTNIALPGACEGQSVVHLRWLYYESASQSGSRDAIRLDDITISSSSAATSSIALSAPTIPTTNINNSTTNNIIGAVQLDVTSVDATLNGVTFTTSGTYTASDISTNGFKFWLSTSASDISSATQLGSAQAAAGNGSNISVSGLTNTITSGTTRYIVLSADIAAAPTNGNTIGIGTTAHSNITFASGTKTGTNPVAASTTRSIAVATSSIAISSNHPAVGNLNQNAISQNIGSIALAVTNANATLNSVTFTTAGTYQTSDLVASSFKLYYTTTNTFGTSIQLGSAQAVVASGNTITFSGLSQSISSATTGYLWLTVDIAYNANTSRNISIASTAFSNITFAAGSKTGTDPVAASNTMSFVAVAPSVAIAPISVSAANIQINSTNNVLANLSFAVTSNTTNLTGVTFNTDATDTYTGSDISNFKLWYSTTNTFGGATQIGSTVTSIPSAGGTITFSPTQNIVTGTTGYLWLTADIASGATAARTINIATTAFSNLSFDNGASKTGTDPVAAFGLQTIVTAVNKYITGTQTWNASNANWATTSGGSYNTTWGSGNIANLEGTSANITLSGTQTASGLNFNQTSITNTIIAGGTGITLSGTPSILVGNAAINQVNYINSPLSATNLVNVGLNNSASGLAILNLGGANTFTSGLQISASTVSRINFNAASAAGTGGVTLNANRVRFTNSGTAGDFASGSTVVSIPTLNLSITGSPYKTVALGGTSNTNMTSLNYDGIISGTLDTVYVGNDVTATGGGNATTFFNVANTYTASTVFNSNSAASLKLGVDNALPTSTTLIFNKGNGGLNTNGFNQKVASIADGVNTGTPGGIVLSSAKVFSIEGSATNTYGGVISGAGSLTLTSTNLGTQTLTGTNTYTGGTNINGGTLSLGASNVLADAGAVTINGGVLNSGGAFSETIGALTLTSGSITGSTGTLTPSSMDVSAGTIDVILAGSGVLTKNTSGTVFLTNGSNTYSGGTTINGGILSVNGANRLGSTAVGVTVNAGTFQLTTTSITSGRAFNFNNSASTFDVATGITYTNTTAIYTGSGILNKTGNGTLTFQTSNTNAQTYNGLNIKGGTISIGKETDLGAVPGTTNASYILLDGGTLLDSNTITIDSKRGIVLGTGGGTINVLSTKTLTYGGIIADNSGAGNLTKTGAGTLTLNGTSNSYTGSTTITTGELRMNPSANATFASQIILNGGTLSTTSIASTRTITSSSTLNLNANSTLALGSNAHTLTFANSSGVTWAGSTLTITGWTGNAGFSGTAGQIFVGVGGLDASQLAKINFSGYTNGAMILGTGELVPFTSNSPTIATGGSLSAVNTTYGTPSATPSTFTVSGINLTSDITITAPSGYEISQTSGGASGYASTQTLTPSGGTVASTTIYVRLTSTATVASSPYTGNVVLTSTGAATVNVATASSTVSTKTLTVTGLTADSRTYDGTTNATFTGSPSLSGVINSDVVNLSGTGTASFVTKTVGTSKTINVTGYSLSGTNANNYSLTQPTLSADVTTATLTVASGATVSNKTYDGNTNATVSSATLNGVFGADVVSVSTTGTFFSANVGTGISVTLALSGADASNYSLTQPGRTANITQASQTITFNALASKLTTDAPFALTATASSGLSVSYSSSNTSVATISGSTVTIVGAGTTTITASQSGDGNYSAASDVQRTLTVTAPIVAGDIVIIGFGSTGTDKFAFLLNRDLPASTILYFTDNGFSGSALATNEGNITWTSPNTVLTAGTVVTIDASPSSSSGTINSFGPALSTSGDQIICYTGTAAGSPTTYIAAISSKPWITTGSTTSNTSYLPTGLIEGVTASNFGSTISDAYYSNILTGPTAILRSLINNSSNWTTSSASQTFPSFATSFTSSATLSANASITNVVLASGETLSIGANTLTIGGSVSGAGTITGGATSNLIIGGSAGTIQFTTGSTSNYLKNLTLNASSSMTIGSNGLNITGGATFGTVTVATGATLTTGGNLTLKSTATGTASIGNSAGTISGNITMERFISQSGRRWRYICAPVTGQTLADWGAKFYITGPGTPGATVGSQNSNGYATSRSNLLGFNNADGTPSSVRVYNRTTSGTIENGWSNPASHMATALTPGTGYRAFIRGPITGNYATDTAVIGYFTPGAPPTQSSFTFTQTGGVSNGVNAGSVSMPINSTGTGASGAFDAATDGWNLIGNPYPCAFDWVAFWASGTNRANIGTAIHVFDATANSYKSYSTQAGSGTLTSGIIPSGSAFFVQATGTGASLTFTEAFKTVSTAPLAVHKQSLSDELHIKYYRDSTESDEYILKMMNDASLQKDVYDIAKLKNDNLNLSSYGSDSINLTLSSIPVVTEETRISLNVEATQKGTYKFDFTTINDFDNGISVSLMDKFTQKTIDIRKNPIYTFVMDSMPHQWGKDRFVLILNASPINTGIGNESSIVNTKMSVYPNPASDVLNISINNSSFKNSNISIYNISGNEVLSSTMLGASTQLNIESLSNGVYFVKVKNENGFDKTVKFIK